MQSGATFSSQKSINNNNLYAISGSIYGHCLHSKNPCSGVSHACMESKSEDSSASKNTDSSVFYTEIETKILNTDSDPQNTDRDPIIRVIAIQQITVTLR